MKSLSKIKARVRALLVEELDRRVEEATKRLPRRCVHNHRQPLDTRKIVEGEPNEGYNRITDKRGLPVVQTIGLCMLGAENPEEAELNICEDPIDAQKCPYFDPRESKSDLIHQFEDQLATPEWVEEHMPDVAVLVWALDEATTLKLPWWRVALFWFLRIHVEPVVKVDPVLLIPEASESDDSSLGT